MITGYLFFFRSNKAQTDWVKALFETRQTYLSVISVIGYIVCGDFYWAEWGRRLIGQGYCCGSGNGGFNVPPLPHFYAKPLIAGAVWTLIYEWAFYSILPILAFCCIDSPNWQLKYSLFVLATTAIGDIFIYAQYSTVVCRYLYSLWFLHILRHGLRHYSNDLRHWCMG